MIMQKAHPDTIGEDFRKVLPVTGDDVISHTIRVLCLEFLASEDIYNVKRLTDPGSNAMAIAPSRSHQEMRCLSLIPIFPGMIFSSGLRLI